MIYRHLRELMDEPAPREEPDFPPSPSPEEDRDLVIVVSVNGTNLGKFKYVGQAVEAIRSNSDVDADIEWNEKGFTSGPDTVEMYYYDDASDSSEPLSDDDKEDVEILMEKPSV